MINSGLNRFIPKLKNAPHTPVNNGVIIAKGLFGEESSYTIEQTMHGNVVIFSDRFINKFLEAITTGCISKMGPQEKDILFAYLKYEDEKSNGTTEYNISSAMLKTSIALDQWLLDEIAKKKHLKINECYNEKFVANRQ